MNREQQTVHYLEQAFKPDDRMAIVLINREKQDNIQRIMTASRAVDPRFQRWLRASNAHGYNVYAHLQVLKAGAQGRRRDDIAEIRHVYVDLDQGGRAVVAKLLERSDLPRPSWILNTSPGKYQVVWRVEGLDIPRADGLTKGLAKDLCADPAATPVTQPSRLPGFANKQYEQFHWVTAERIGQGISRPQDFPERLYLPVPLPDARRQRCDAPGRNGGQPVHRVAAGTLIADALEQVQSEGRNRAGLNCAIQFRDNGYSQTETEAFMRSGFLPCVPETDRLGKRQLYTGMEMVASIRSAFSRPAREPWPEREFPLPSR